jgi:hypothetical protein
MSFNETSLTLPVALPEPSPARTANIARVFDALRDEGNDDYTYARVSVEYGGVETAHALREVLEIIEVALRETGEAHVLIL